MGAFVAFFALPSFTNITEQDITTKKTQQVVDQEHWATNLANVLTAYEAEINTSAKYEAYSKQAKKEGHSEIALLFKAISKASKIHANSHKAILEAEGIAIPFVEPIFNIKSTKENLKEAISIENDQITKIYSLFIIEANLAQNQLSKKSMNFAYMASHKHKALYEKALDAMENNDTKLLATTYFLCPNCGNIYEQNVNPACEFCETNHKNLIRIEG